MAAEWMDKGAAARAVKLLEPLFADVGGLDERAEYAFDTLVECYNALGKPLKKKRLIERAMSAPDRVLALYRLNRRDEALSALQQARRDHAEILKMLLHPAPRKPRLREGTVTMGGRDEAWYCREGHLDLWKDCGALEWARDVSGRTRPRVA